MLQEPKKMCTRNYFQPCQTTFMSLEWTTRAMMLLVLFFKGNTFHMAGITFEMR